MYCLDGIQHRIYLGDDLNDCFGFTSVSMVGIVITLIQCEGIFDSVAGRLQRTWVRRYYDLAGSFDSGLLSHMTKKIGRKDLGNIDAFFECRMRRNEGTVAWDTIAQGRHSDIWRVWPSI